MAKPQTLPDPLPTDIQDVKDLIDTKLSGLATEKTKVKEGKEDAEEYHRQISKLRKHADEVLGLNDYNPDSN
jgi:hypothetical protein